MPDSAEQKTPNVLVRGTLVPTAAALFGLAEFASDWEWRPLAQVALALVALRSVPWDGWRPRAWDLVAALVLALAAWSSRSAAWGIVAVLCVAGERAFPAVAAATMGAGCLYLHGLVLPAALPPLARLLALLPWVDLDAQWLVWSGERIHTSAFSLATAVSPIAAVLALRALPGAQLAAVAATSLAAGAALRVGLVLALLAAHQPLWATDPLAVGLYCLAAALVASRVSGEAASPPPHWRRMGVAALAGVALWAALAPGGPSSPRRLRVVLDDAHGEWEPTERAFTRTRYGRDTVYTYSLLREWLSRRHAVEVDRARPFRPRGDVVVVKTPALAFTAEEQTSLLSYVGGGGGLLAIGDHTNLFGTTDHLNSLLEPCGLTLRNDAVIPLEGVTRTMRASWWQAGPLLALGESWEVQTSASINANTLGASPLLVDAGVVAEAAEYSNERNFGELKPSLDDAQPPLVVAAAAPCGRGRVVLLADSTPWSNFSFFAPPNKEILGRALALTAAPNREQWRLAWVLIAGVLLLVSVLRGASVLHPVGAACGVYGLLIAASAGLMPAQALPAAPAKDLLLVDADAGPVNWNTDIRTDTAGDRDVYSTFLAWISRAGVEPEFRERGTYADARIPVLVLNPSRPVSAEGAAARDAYVREGGRLLVVDDPEQRPRSTGADVLRPFGIEYRFEVTESRIHESQGPQLPDLVWALPLTLLQQGRQRPGPVLAGRAGLGVTLVGVTPLWVDEHGLVVYGERRHGSGRVMVFARSRAFSQLVMGDVWGGVEPGEENLRLYELEYALLDRLMRPAQEAKEDILEDIRR